MHTEFEILEALFRAYDAHDLEQVASLYAANATHVDIAAGRPKQGRDRIVEGLASFVSGFPDAHWTASASATGGGRAFGQYVVTGTLQRDLWSFNAFGQQLELAGVLVLHCRNGLITRSEDYWDAGTFRRQMTHIQLADDQLTHDQQGAQA
jgi:steroid delta-isomerase-like uncharacterized protein